MRMGHHADRCYSGEQALSGGGEEGVAGRRSGGSVARAVNGGFTYVETIDGRGAGRALLGHLSARHRHSSPEEWRERIEAGLVLVDGLPARGDDALRRGQRVTWARPPWEEPEAPLSYAVLHEDAALLAVAKPSGLPTLPGAGYLDHTLLALVRQNAQEAYLVVESFSEDPQEATGQVANLPTVGAVVWGSGQASLDGSNLHVQLPGEGSAVFKLGSP